ncbi:MAG: hypothetical protein KAY32_17275 [Candidatus Eisenbacteria sp.]|nr:hypothetical protein [Candidatus Eisenbacteria bacterium]
MTLLMGRLGRSGSPRACRLTHEERNAIHKAAGAAKVSKFARSLLVAAARNDEAAVRAILKDIQTT